MKKVLAIGLIAALVTSALVGCGKKEPEKTPEVNDNPTKTVEENVELSIDKMGPLEFEWYVNRDSFASREWGVQYKGEEWLKEKGINVALTGPNGAKDQRFSTMLVSGDYPEVMVVDRGAEVERLREAGALVPLDDYINKYTNLKKYCGEETLNMLRSSDGKIYQFPNWYIGYGKGSGNAGWLVNKEIHKALGEPKLETYDDLYSYLKLVQEKYPDIIPLETHDGANGLDVMYATFAENHTKEYMWNLFYKNGDKLDSLYRDPVFKEFVLYSSKLFREKLIDQDTFTQTRDQSEEKTNTGRYAVAVSKDIIRTTVQEERSNPNAVSEVIWPIGKAGLDKNKLFPNNFTSLGWNVNVITKNAKDPEKIFAFMDWLTGPEGQRVAEYGPLGYFYDSVDKDGFPIVNDKFKNATPDEINFAGTENWVGNTYFVDTAKSVINEQLGGEKEKVEVKWQSRVTWKTSVDTTEYSNMTPMPDSDLGKIFTRVKENHKEAYQKMIFAKSDEEVLQILDAADKQATADGFDKVLEFMTQKWQENKAKLKK
jgi:ABC-type glycerol-3-phosphate transport system substrate-binding protein